MTHGETVGALRIDPLNDGVAGFRGNAEPEQGISQSQQRQPGRGNPPGASARF